jgi:hypothetical protein
MGILCSTVEHELDVFHCAFNGGGCIMLEPHPQSLQALQCAGLAQSGGAAPLTNDTLGVERGVRRVVGFLFQFFYVYVETSAQKLPLVCFVG